METKFLIIAILIALMIAMLCFIGCQKEEDDNESEIIESIQAELETTGEVTLTLFETQQEGETIYKYYVAKVDGHYYITCARYNEMGLYVDVEKEI